ncbi:hypothetical protein ACJA3J_05625 [Halobacillus sp. SY10]|uniref:hypothetical protein n=1 Tax=Halobacillus sp. SY10 TaxID=3381356 RepID=UPI003878FA72
MPEFDVIKALKAQEKYCEESGAPHFAPKGGSCWNCRKNIYEHYHWKFDKGNRSPATAEESNMRTGISVKEAASTLVTGCPHCNRTYCD